MVGGVLVVETRYLEGGAGLAAYIIEKALADPGFRAALGGPESLSAVVIGLSVPATR